MIAHGHASMTLYVIVNHLFLKKCSLYDMTTATDCAMKCHQREWNVHSKLLQTWIDS